MTTPLHIDDITKIILDYAHEPNARLVCRKYKGLMDQIYKFDAQRFQRLPYDLRALEQDGFIPFKALKRLNEDLYAVNQEAAKKLCSEKWNFTTQINKHLHELNSFPHLMGDFRVVLEEITLQAGKPKLSKISDSLAVQYYRSLLNEEDLKKITTLKIFGKKISHFPPEFFRLTSLKTLNLSQNEITTIPEGFANFKKLTELSLSHNEISSIPLFLANLPIKNLNLSYNHIEIIPHELAKMPLRYLNLSHNPFQELPDEVADLIDGCSFLLRDIHFPVVFDTFGRLFKV